MMCHKRKNLPSLCIALSTNMLILLDLLHWIHSVNLVKFYFTQLWSNFYAVELSFNVNLHVGFSFFVIVLCQTFYFVINFLTMKWISLNSCSVWGWERISKGNCNNTHSSRVPSWLCLLLFFVKPFILL